MRERTHFLPPAAADRMSDWHLSFQGTRRLTLAEWESWLAGAVGPVTTACDEWSGNPRDYYWREIRLTSARDGVRVELLLHDNQRGPDDPEEFIDETPTVRLRDAPFEIRLALWTTLTDAFARIDYHDRTLTQPWSSAILVKEAEAAGRKELVERWRAATTGALAAEGPGFLVQLISMHLEDIETVLASRPQPEIVRSLSLTNCGLTALPKDITRFSNLAELTVVEDEPKQLVLEGAPIPTLEKLALGGSGLRTLRRQDLSGFPILNELWLSGGAIEMLDPEILIACPKLAIVWLIDTPLKRDSAAWNELRSRWPSVTWLPHPEPPERTEPTPKPKPKEKPAPRRRELPAPPTEGFTFESGVLTVEMDHLSVDQVCALLATGAYRSAIAFHVGGHYGNRMGDEIVVHLVRTRALPEIRELRVELTDAGARALARSKSGHARLEHLWIGGRDKGVSDPVVLELARAQSLPALRTITRFQEHRFWNGADQEVAQIARGDGRVVESIIEHSIWP
jgi:hypothetical protein